jgi:5-formyltetrahydrofolate cyclo-ligase
LGAIPRKPVLRRETIARILAVDPAERAAQDAALAARFLTLPDLERARAVLLFASAFPEEVDTGPMLRHVRECGKRLICPRVDRRERCLKLFEVDDPIADLVPGTLGIPEPHPTCRSVEPDQVDWVLVPGLAFDASCHRLGRGAGHYDRLLPTLRPGVPRWALIFEQQWVAEVPVEPHDVRLDGVASPSRIVCRAATQLGSTSTFTGSE